MKIKRLLLPIIILSMFIILAGCLTACDSNNNNESGNNGGGTDAGHTHSFSAWETTTVPSCFAPGMQTRTCSCGFSEYSQIDALGHTPVTDAAIAATCIANGKSEGSHCSSCGATIVAQQTIQALQHAYGNANVITEATCVKNGTKRYSCTNNGCNHYYDEAFSLQEYTSTEIYNQALKYTGEILTYDKKGQPLAQGTGFVCSADGKIITNHHVIEGAYSATITIGNDIYTIQYVLAYDVDIDLAVLKINATGLTPAVVCKNDPVTAETVYAIGSPRGFTATVSVGVVSYAKRVVNGVTYVQHDADITHGSSGGPLINKYGEVIGVNAGAFGNAEINVAVFTGELDKLTYGTPLTMAQFYDLHHTANNVLTEWLIDNYNSYTDGYIYYEIKGTDFIYSISYNIEDDYNFLDGYWTFDDGANLYISIDLDATTGIYEYYAHYTAGSQENYTRGYIYASSYNASTVLTHTSYSGAYWDESTLMNFYSSAVSSVMEWFTYCLNNYIDDLSLSDFGFTSLKYNYDSTALTKLNTMIKYVGTYDSVNGWYEIEDKSYYTNYSVYFLLGHIPANGSNSNSTFASMGWYGKDGTEYFVYLQFYTTGDWGNYFGCSYKYKKNGVTAEENSTYGYLDAATFTPNTELTYREFDGMEAYEDDLLKTYSACFADLMEWVCAVLDNQGVAYSIDDLGFIFYYG